MMDRLEAAQAVKDAAEADLAKVMAVVAEIQGRLDQLQQTFLEATNEKAKVEIDEARAKLEDYRMLREPVPASGLAPASGGAGAVSHLSIQHGQ